MSAPDRATYDVARAALNACRGQEIQAVRATLDKLGWSLEGVQLEGIRRKRTRSR